MIAYTAIAGATSTRPIIIVSAGRSGSTVLHRVLARHPDVAWASQLLGKNPKRPWMNRALLGAIDVPLLRRPLLLRYRPIECYAFWDRHYPGFSSQYRDLRADDVTAWTKDSLREACRRLSTARRTRLLFKITGWPRIGFLKEVFPDAKFIHVFRDGRAAAASLLRMRWWDGWRGPENWRWGPLSSADAEEWEAHGRSFVALAGIQWKILMAAVREAEKALPDEDLLEVRYEEMCAEPLRVFAAIGEFAELPWTGDFRGVVRRRRFHNQNDRWRRDLTPEQQRVLEAVLHTDLARYGYV
jgi:hypothetical protein